MNDDGTRLTKVARWIAILALVILIIWIPTLILGLRKVKGPSHIQWMIIIYGFLGIVLLAILAFILQASHDVIQRFRKDSPEKEKGQHASAT